MWAMGGGFEALFRQIWGHPLFTAAIFFALYVFLASLRERMHWRECTLPTKRSDRSGFDKPMRIASKILSR